MLSNRKPPTVNARSSGRFRALLAVLAAAVCLFAGPAIASAHSKLLSSTPVAGAVLVSSPTVIRLDFSEAVSLEFSSVKVYDHNRAEQTTGVLQAAAGDGNRVGVSVPSPLAPGTYTVVWRVVSAIDGHLTVGSFAFRVRGQGGTPEPEVSPVPLAGYGETATEGSAESASPLRWLLRAIILSAAAVVIGGALFTVLVTEPVLEERSEKGRALWAEVNRRSAAVGLAAALALVAALGLDLFAEVSAIGATGFFQALGRLDLVSLLVGSTRYGFAWAMKFLAAAGLGVLCAWILLRSRRGQIAAGVWELAIAGGSLLLLAEALSSHGAATDAGQFLGLPVPVVSNWLHLVMASTWAGGVAHMGLALFPAFHALSLTNEERRFLLARAVPRFSRLALLSVVTLTLTGVYNLAVQSTDLGAIAGSVYGQVLGVKVGLFTVLVGLGSANLLWLTPRLLRKRPGASQVGGQDLLPSAVPALEPPLEAASPAERPAAPSPARTPASALLRNVRAEMALITLVLFCAGGLTLLPPPPGAGNTYAAGNAAADVDSAGTVMPAPEPSPSPTAVAPTPGPVSAGSQVGGYGVTLHIAPSPDGDTVTLTMTRSLPSVPALNDIRKVVFRLSSQQLQAGTQSLDAQEASGGSGDVRQWSARGELFTHEDTYLLNAVIQRTDAPDLRAAFRIAETADNSLSISAEPAVDARLSTDPSPPLVGENAVSVNLVDGEGTPVGGAVVTVSVQSSRAERPGPPAVAQPVSGRPGSYSLSVTFDQAGAWTLQVRVERPGLPTVTQSGSLDVSPR